MLSRTSFTKESIEGGVIASIGLIVRHKTIRLDTVLKAVQLPACIANLDSGLADMNGNDFTLKTKINVLLSVLNACWEMLITTFNRPG